MNIAMLLDMAVDAFGDRIGVTCDGQSLTFTEIKIQAQRAAKYFRDSGASHVALLDTNGPVLPIAIFGAAYAGIPYVPLNYRLTTPEINALLARVTPALLVAGEQYHGLVETTDITVVDTNAILALEGEIDAEEEGLDGMLIDPESTAVQLFTSGTTGTPKAALLKHENLTSYILGTVEFAAAMEDEAVLVTVPPYHVAGIAAVLSSTYACRRMVQIEAFDPEVWISNCRNEATTSGFLVPTMIQRIVEHLDDSGEAADMPSLRSLAYGGGKMPLTVIKRAMELLPNVDFTNAYGLTETSSTICVLTPDDHREAMQSSEPAVQRRLGSAGQVTGAVEIEIRDEAGQAVAADEVGMIFVRGGQVAGNYKEQGSQLDDEGWFCTKDQGFLDDQGYLFIDGRADDVIVRGGENISPGEIEDVLREHPAIADVAVAAMPDEQWGEGVGAAIVYKSDTMADIAELQEFVKQRLRSSRVPQAFLVKDELPYNDMGKVLRRVIRQELAEI